MNWWYAENGTHGGPVDTDRLMALVANGTLTADSRVWALGMPDWCPMWQVEVLQERLRRIVPLPPAPAASAATVPAAGCASADGVRPGEAGPWSRFVARGIDVVLFGALVAFVFVPLVPAVGESTRGEFVTGLLVLPAALVVDAVVLGLFGTTPGKSFLAIRVRAAEGRRLGVADCLRRNLVLWVAGFGLGLPIIYLMTMYLSYRRVKAGLRCIWDEARMYTVGQREIGAGRFWLAFLVMLIGFSFLMFITAAARYQGA